MNRFFVLSAGIVLLGFTVNTAFGGHAGSPQVTTRPNLEFPPQPPINVEKFCFNDGNVMDAMNMLLSNKEQVAALMKGNDKILSVTIRRNFPGSTDYFFKAGGDKIIGGTQLKVESLNGKLTYKISQIK